MWFVQELFASIVDLFFPEVCPFCNKIIYEKSTLVCSSCLSKIEFVPSPLCTSCGKPFPVETQDDHYCGDCLTEKRYYTKVRAVLFYEGEVMEAIHRFKYSSAIYLARPLGWFMYERSREFINFSEYDCLIPVPLHKRRLRKREFNQAQLLAEELTKYVNLPVELSVLERIKETPSQVGLKKEERQRNVWNAFQVHSREKIKNKTILLIDDVLSTTATVNEAAKALIRAGADRVDVLTLARGNQNVDYHSAF